MTEEPGRARCLALLTLLALGGCGRVGYRTSEAGLDAGPDGRADTGGLDGGGGADAQLDARDEVDAAAGATDASSDSAGADAFCPGLAEACNGLDDDCDGRVDETFRVVGRWDECSSPPRAGRVTLVGSTWDAADALRSATIVEGGIELSFPITTPGALLLAPDLTIGNLLVPPATGMPQGAALPFVGGDPMLEPNVDRAAIEIGFDAAFAVHDGPGDDLVVLEQGDPVTEPEAFTVMVRDARTGTWSRRRWEFFDVFGDTDLLFATRYDLADFGLVGGVIDRIRIESVFGADAPLPDRVTDPRGEGFVVRGAEADWPSAQTLLLTAGGTAVPVELLDADLLWIAALHPLVAPGCCVP